MRSVSPTRRRRLVAEAAVRRRPTGDLSISDNLFRFCIAGIASCGSLHFTFEGHEANTNELTCRHT
jgi:hypothetical protein